MISAGSVSLVLFADRTLLLWHSGSAMSAAMAGGNLFWVSVCLPIGIVSMTGAIVGQHVGSGENHKVGRLIWQAIWLSLAFAPIYLALAYWAKPLLVALDQPADLLDLEATYFRLLMLGAIGIVIENALSGFFSGLEMTRIVMWISILTSILNFLLDLVLIFGFGPIPEMGIAGAAIATLISIWFKTICFAVLILRPKYEAIYKIRAGFGIDRAMLRNLLFFGLPSGLMYITESGGFAAIILRIGRLGDLPLRATTMAINFNMIAFIPLVGLSVAASVLTGKYLLESGPRRAARYARAAMMVGLAYSLIWSSAYICIPRQLIEFYALEDNDAVSMQAMEVAIGLLAFVSAFLLLDTIQLIVAGALRGAGDTWYVLFAGAFASITAVSIGIIFEPAENGLYWWWKITLFWLVLLMLAMVTRFIQGGWKRKRMV